MIYAVFIFAPYLALLISAALAVAFGILILAFRVRRINHWVLKVAWIAVGGCLIALGCWCFWILYDFLGLWNSR